MKKSLLLALFFVASLGAEAQLLDPADYNDPNGIDPNSNQQNQTENSIDPAGDPAIPIDGGLSLLLAAGLGYGANRIRKNRNKIINKQKSMNFKSNAVTGLLFFICSFQIAHAQVGIGTSSPSSSSQLEVNSTSKGFLPPRMTSAQRASIASPATGLMVYQTDQTTGIYSYNGNTWVSLSTANFGDIKTGIQSTDHNGWIRLNGRLKSSLTSTQQSQATALGIGTYLPDATNAYLVQNGGTLGSVSGSNAKTISRDNLPNVTLNGTTSSNGEHSHTIGFTTSATNWNWTMWNPGTWGVTISGTATTSTAASHEHTFTTSSINGGVNQTSLDVTPRSISVNTFIYLGQ